MKHSFQQACLIAGCALSISLFSCNGNHNNSSTSPTDTSATTATTPPADTTNTANANNNTTTDANTQFVNDVAPENAKEIMMLQAGIAKGTSRELKEDARKMLADHKKLAKQLEDYASKKSITLPTPDTSMNNMGDLNGKTGKDFDKAWADDMVDGHKKTIARFEKGQNEVTDQDLKQLITNTLPTLHSHLDMVTKLQNNLSK